MKRFIPTLIFIFLAMHLRAQVGINTVTPHVSAVLDIETGATPKGMLAPRMTTAQRLEITSPAESLLVFDTTEKAFYFYNTATTSWTKLANANDAASKRTNYKLIKSAADLAAELAAGGNSKYLLNANTYYEINGTVTLSHPIELNSAYVSGLDANDDALTRPGGTIFAGTTGGSIRNVTLSNSAEAFNITAGAGAATLIVQNTIISGMTTRVGLVSGFAMYFANIVQYLGNTNGITYSNIGNLLLSNQGWFASNKGTYETFTGTFGFIQKNSGFSTVSGAAVALDVSANPTVPTAIIYGTVFSGATTAASGIIKRYSVGSYDGGYSFTNNWYVDAPGIPREGDSEATGDINLDVEVGSIAARTTFTNNNTKQKLEGATQSFNSFRFLADGNNRIRYVGNKTRYFQVTASVSYQSTSDITILLYIAKNGVPLTQTKVYGKGAAGFFTSSGILALPIVGTVQLAKNDYIEIWAERIGGTGQMDTVSLNLTAR